MKVYIVFEDIHYGEDEVQKVFSCEDKAHQYREELEKIYGTPGLSYYVEGHEVE